MLQYITDSSPSIPTGRGGVLYPKATRTAPTDRKACMGLYISIGDTMSLLFWWEYIYIYIYIPVVQVASN